MTKRTIVCAALLFVLGTTACGGPSGAQVSPTVAPVSTVTPEPIPTPTPDPIRERVEAMTDEELAGQLLVVGIEGTTPGEDARAAIEELGVSGVILFARNIESGDQLTALTTALKDMNAQTGHPSLFLCIDEEGGRVARLAPLEGDLPTPYDYTQAYLNGTGQPPADFGRTLAQRCAKYGLNVDFAPSLDVWSNPDNTVIGKRAYGSDATTVSLAVSVAQAMAEQGIIPAGKHFPGHGDTATDSHVGLPVVNKSLDELSQMELIPFRKAIEEGVPAIMTAHILLPQIDPDLPATLSPAVINGLLRTDLGFDGVVFTDDLNMGAIAQHYGLGQAAVLAAQAGCDQLLVCHGADNAKTAHAALVSALADGSLPREQVQESVYRVLSLKAQFFA